MDRVQNWLLAAVALGLFANALGPWAVAQANSPMRCEVSGPIEVRITNFSDDLEVNLEHGAPGSSSSRPLYVEQNPN
ncbi:MAG: hypothetical protein KTR31_41285 [Myxococcales bacterium]|nr:hypothetical protein [Myxococcales bacterium]